MRESAIIIKNGTFCSDVSGSRSAGSGFDNGFRHFPVRFVAQIELQFLEPVAEFFVLAIRRKRAMGRGVRGTGNKDIKHMVGQ